MISYSPGVQKQKDINADTVGTDGNNSESR
jgi:hypothetical protein